MYAAHTNVLDAREREKPRLRKNNPAKDIFENMKKKQVAPSEKEKPKPNRERFLATDLFVRNGLNGSLIALN